MTLVRIHKWLSELSLWEGIPVSRVIIGNSSLASYRLNLRDALPPLGELKVCLPYVIQNSMFTKFPLSVEVTYLVAELGKGISNNLRNNGAS